LKKLGPRHTYAEGLLMKQVATEFTKKWKALGSGKKAAEELGVNPKSFYNYAHATDLPRVEVLKAAHKKWGIKWDLIDTATLLRAAKPISAEQLVLPLIRSVREEDVEVIEVTAASDSSLRVMLKIRFATQGPTRNQVSTKR
jgi:hypothetical protein